jgi:uncharacterized protein YeaO (DUF488 family)
MASVRQRTATGRARNTGASGKAAGAVCIKRAYEKPDTTDGYRALVDRLWPRGVRKDALAVDDWMKEIGPSDELRRWFGHDPARWDEFAARYRDELRREPAAGLVADLVARASRGPVTLVYSAKDELHNQAIVLRDVIEQRMRRAAARAPAAKDAAPRALAPSARPRASATRRTGRRAAPTRRTGARARPS